MESLLRREFLCIALTAVSVKTSDGSQNKSLAEFDAMVAKVFAESFDRMIDEATSLHQIQQAVTI